MHHTKSIWPWYFPPRNVEGDRQSRFGPPAVVDVDPRQGERSGRGVLKRFFVLIGVKEDPRQSDKCEHGVC